MKKNLYRGVGLIFDVDVNVALSPDMYPPLIGDEGYEIVLVEQWPNRRGK